MIELNSGIRFGSSIVLDPTRVQPKAIVSHAHADHLKKHKTIYATAPTIDFAHVSNGDFKGVPLEYGQVYKIGDCSVRLEPAGHICGSAQTIIDYAGHRTVYTGDLKLTTNETCLPADIHGCDILFIDTTFGKKAFNFPEYGYLKQRLLEFVDTSLYADCIPVINAYNLGKAQEAMKIVGDAGFKTYVTDLACKYADIHCKHGVNLKNYSVLNENYPEAGAVILPPTYKNIPNLFPSYRKRTCFISGWALNRGYIRTGYFDEYIPLSDHASYNDIIRYVETAKPKKVYCLFGFKDVVDELKYRGFNAAKVTMANRKGVGRYVIEEPNLFS